MIAKVTTGHAALQPLQILAIKSRENGQPWAIFMCYTNSERGREVQAQ